MNPLLDTRSRNYRKPSPVSQRIQGFEHFCNEKNEVAFLPRLTNACTQSNQIQSVRFDSSASKSQSSNVHQHSIKTGKGTTNTTENIQSRKYIDLLVEKLDFDQTTVKLKSKQVTKNVNFPEHTASISHPYYKAINKSSVVSIQNKQSNSTSKPELMTSQGDKPELACTRYKQNSCGIYKPVYSGQTRYPNPTKVESTHLPSNSIVRSHHQINLQTYHSNNGNSSSNDLTGNVHKYCTTKQTSAKSQYTILTGGDLYSCRSNSSLNKSQCQNSNVTNIRTKPQNRIFEPENMDFSQLSNNHSLNIPQTMEVSSSESLISKTVENPMVVQNVHHSEHTNLPSTHRESFELFPSNITNDNIPDEIYSPNLHDSFHEGNKLLQPGFNIPTNILKNLSSEYEGENCFACPSKAANYFAPSIDDAKLNPNQPNQRNEIDLDSLSDSTLYNLGELERKTIWTNTLPKKIHSIPCNVTASNEQGSYHSRTHIDPRASLNIQICRPLSLSKIDVQNWIRDTIVMKDSITAAFLISSHIFEKTSFYIAQRHALERQDTDSIIDYYQTQVAELLNMNIILRKKLFYLLFQHVKSKSFNNHLDPIRKCKIRRICSLPGALNNGTTPGFSELPKSSISGLDESQCNDVLLQANCQDANHLGSAQDMVSFNSSEIIQYYPSPPPDLPELDQNKIPQPPPNLPIVDHRLLDGSESVAISRPMKCKVGVSLKPLHWKRLSIPNRKNKIEIVWKMLPRQRMKPNDLILFEESFSTQTPRKLFKSLKNQNIHSNQLPLEILPQEIARQLGIVSKNFESVHIHLEDIEDMLYSGDIKRSNLTTSILENLSKLITDERIRFVYDYVSKNPKVELTKESRIIHFFRNIPHVTMRFQHIIYMQNFEEDIEHIHRNLVTIYHCCAKLRNSHELRILLSIILMLGNYMNQTYNSFKEAIGFNLEILPRLKETKSVDNSSTFLDFVSKCYLLNFEHNISQGSITNILPFPDTGDLFVASKITLHEVYESLSKLGDQLTKIHANTRRFLLDSSNGKSKEYVEIVERFFQFAEKKIADEIEFWKLGDKTYQELIYYFYGESKFSGNHIDNNDFFELWSNFASSFKEALVRAHKNIAIKRRNDFIKSDTKIIPICPSGLKQKVRYRTGCKSKFYHSTKPLNIN